MACKPHRWPATRAEVEALIGPALSSSPTLRDAGTVLGVTEADLRGVTRVHQIDYAKMLARPAISPGVVVSAPEPEPSPAPRSAPSQYGGAGPLGE